MCKKIKKIGRLDAGAEHTEHQKEETEAENAADKEKSSRRVSKVQGTER